MAKICDNLRASILQAAMQGKLTEQLPSDGNAKELMYQILERPGRQACSYINTTDKGLIDDSCIDLPDTWEALLVGDVFSLSSGERSYSSKEPLPLLNANYFRGRSASRIKNGSLVKAGNYVILVDGENSGEIFKCSEDGFLGSTFKVLDIPDVLNEDYCRYYFKLRQEELRNNKKGAAIPHLNKSIFFNLAFPIPPLAEQKRIVEKIDELFARVADLERSADALASLNKTFPGDIKASILQAAMQGKLTEQLPSDGNAEDLYQQIQAEKAKLIKEGKIKKTKPLPPIDPNEIPFDIPENWKWVRLGDIIDVRDGTHDTPKYVPEGVKLLTSKNIRGGVIDLSTAKYISRNDAAEINKRSRVDEGDILMAMIGTIGNPVLVDKRPDYCIKNVALLKPILSSINMRFLLLYLKFAVADMNRRSSGGVQKFVSLDFLRRYYVPLPPLAEQKRIVEKLDNLLAEVDNIANAIG